MFTSDATRILQALDKSLAIIEFAPDGTILRANPTFLAVMGYSLGEIVGMHHSLFVDGQERDSAEYRHFWEKLAQGIFDRRQYRRIGKGGREIWIEASYNPIIRRGRVQKIVKVATDITASKGQAAEAASKLGALSRAQAIIEFTLDGHIIAANDNFLRIMGYRLEDIVGRHHAIFCSPETTADPAYRAFWEALRQGEYFCDRFTRLAADGRLVHIAASYNPVYDAAGRVTRVVKFATDVTDLVRDVGRLGDGLQTIAAGDLTVRLDTPLTPEMEPLRRDFNEVVERMASTIREILEDAESIARSAQQLSTATEDLYNRTETQARALEHMSSNVGSVSERVLAAADLAGQSGRLVHETRGDAERSASVVGDAVQAMGEIESSSRQIASIIGVIDEIAFQTNLLALNAGVEAARAGEAGKGFAVVAQEVRALAQRSALAAKEIEVLIRTSGGQVEKGVAFVHGTRQALAGIAAQFEVINANVDRIVESSQTQTTELKDIHEGITGIDRSTQLNAGMVEQSYAATGMLAERARHLFSLLGHFTVADRGAAADLDQPANIQLWA
ncbi:methyl-accepting chemotaxis protein [Gellertiella hungarica]|uniref:Methyl-accepting chemotaxis protein n=1 Tax=Gellertiella hungarica TaxID=1572859 RepID=A0A7W6NLY4_9HYPH|nr:methyl-accepting chemotaxis protein [Gellertiella hungarica]MBB4066069.1 methyl-accepting chemotaxis protein [Gellertiella hungarica]